MPRRRRRSSARSWGCPRRVASARSSRSRSSTARRFDFAQVADGDAVHPQHYAFLVTEDDFDQIYGRILERSIEHYPEPHFGRTNEINHNDGGRGVYWCDPSGHFLEILTVPYGGWPAGSTHAP